MLLIGVVSVSPSVGCAAPARTIKAHNQSAPGQQAAPTKQTQNSASTTENSASSPQPSSSPNNAVKKPSKGKKRAPANCNSAAPQSAASKGASADKTPDAATSHNKSDAASSSRCPPTKVIVRQGSTSEPGIELVGGAAGPQASDERNTANKMLETTEANLKKMEAAQLNPNQRDMIKQVRQFMDQSKAATSAGDLDQARTLAWKAQLLSEDLLKTQP